MHHPPDRITHTTAFVTPVVEHWLEREIAQWVHPIKDRSDDPSHHEQTLLPPSYISLLVEIAQWVHPMKDRSDDPSHHERTLLPQSYISLLLEIAQWVHPMKDRSDDPSHHERTLLPRSYISLHHEGSIRRPIAPWVNTLTTELRLAPPDGTRNSSMGPPHEGSIRRPIAPWANALTTELHLAPGIVTMTMMAGLDSYLRVWPSVMSPLAGG